MKNLVKFFGAIVVAGVILFSCTSNPEAKGDKEDTKNGKALSLDKKARNTFKNTTVVFSGSMVLAFSEVFKSQAEGFSNAFSSELSDEAVSELDAQIAGLGEEILLPLEEMMNHMDAIFDNLSEEDLSLYEKIFLHDVMKEGIAITEKYELPAGFRPLSQTLSRDEIKRYIIKITTDGQDMKDPIMKTYMELFEWFQKVGAAFDSDQDIQSFLESIRG